MTRAKKQLPDTPSQKPLTASRRGLWQAVVAAGVLTWSASLEARRSKLLALSLWISAAGAALALATAEAAQVVHGRLIVDFGLMATALTGTLTAVACGLSAFAGDVEGRTVSVVLSHPVPRWCVVWGRAAGLWLVLVAMVAVMGTTTYVMRLICAPLAPQGFWPALTIIPVELAVVVATTLCCAAVASRTWAALFSVALLVAGNLSEDILSLSTRQAGTPAAWLWRVLHGVLPDYAHLSLRHLAANELSISWALWATTCCYGLCYAAAALTLATLAFSARRSL